MPPKRKALLPNVTTAGETEWRGAVGWHEPGSDNLPNATADGANAAWHGYATGLRSGQVCIKPPHPAPLAPAPLAPAPLPRARAPCTRQCGSTCRTQPHAPLQTPSLSHTRPSPAFPPIPNRHPPPHPHPGSGNYADPYAPPGQLVQSSSAPPTDEEQAWIEKQLDAQEQKPAAAAPEAADSGDGGGYDDVMKMIEENRKKNEAKRAAQSARNAEIIAAFEARMGGAQGTQ